MPEILGQMPGAIRGLKESLGASEFHCQDIFQGTREFKNVELSLRLGVLEFLAHIFRTYRFPIFVQTIDPVNLADIHRREPGFKGAKAGPFDFSKPRGAALFFLLIRVREYLVKERRHSQQLARLFVDEGFMKSGRALKIPVWKDVFADGLLCSMSSATVLPLQLADFAAYALNRHQILRSRKKLSPLDRTLLGILTRASLNFQNIPTVSVKVDEEGGWAESLE
jgi:hypothetical protein